MKPKAKPSEAQILALVLAILKGHSHLRVTGQLWTPPQPPTPINKPQQHQEPLASRSNKRPEKKQILSEAEASAPC